jgi:hypothetical protein
VRRFLKIIGLASGVTLAIALFPVFFPNFGRNRGVAPGEERVPPDEAAAISKTVATILRVQERRHHELGGRALRDAHAKTHGCVRASFVIADGLAAPLAQGLFSQPAKYDAVIRFSNSDGVPQSDLVRDGRGLAVKLLGVPGEKLSDDEPTSQDFVMINHPVFVVRNAADYVEFIDAIERRDQGFFLGLTWPWRWHLHEAWVGYNLTNHTLVSPLDETYYSISAYRLGARAIKFSAAPCSAEPRPLKRTGDDANLLGRSLAETLRDSSACFDFRVQLQGDPHDMPVEDPTIEWTAPFATVARITIPPQSPDVSDACDDLSFSPWHARVDHRPLGGINRMRRAAYAAISRFRHAKNGLPVK